jgi:hypothetical protein
MISSWVYILFFILLRGFIVKDIITIWDVMIILAQILWAISFPYVIVQSYRYANKGMVPGKMYFAKGNRLNFVARFVLLISSLVLVIGLVRTML